MPTPTRSSRDRSLAVVDRRLPSAAALLGVLLATPTIASEATAPPSHYALNAELRPLAVSACGRYALDASARFAPEAKSADGRFALKAVNVPTGGCEPLPDPLFANGFENP